MQPARFWSAAMLALALSAPPLRADDANIPYPQSACSQGPGQCYSNPELATVAQDIAKKNEDVPIIQSVLTNPYPPGADVHYPDVQGVAGYFQNEEGIRQGAENVLVQYDHLSQDQAAALLNQQPLQARSTILGLIQSGQVPQDYMKQSLAPYWIGGHQTMQQIIGAKGPFVMALNNAKNDPLVPMMMKPLPTGGGETLPPVTTPSQLQQSQPDNPQAYVDGAQDSAANGDMPGAISQASKALALDPDNQQARDIRGAANLQLGNKDDARADATKALSLDPNDQTAKAILQLGQDQVRGGVRNPADPFGQNPAGAGSIDDGVAGGAGGSIPSQPGASGAQASTLTGDAAAALSVGDAATAISALDKRLALNPHDLDALNLRALALARQHRFEDSLRDAAAALAVDPKNQAAMDTRAMALNKLKRWEEAAAQARAALEANPNDAKAYRNLAEALAGLGDKAGSLEALRKAAELDASYQKTLDTALQLPSDADLNLLFAGDDPTADSHALDSAARRKPWDLGFILAVALGSGLLLALGLWPMYSRRVERAWARLLRRQVVRASEVQYIAEPLLKGQYRLGREIGSGGMGLVYEGADVALERAVAIKKARDEIKRDARLRARFVQEAKVVASLHHPNIVDIFAIAEEGDDVYLVFEFVKGKTLHELIAARGRLRLEEALPILRGAVEGLDFAHGRGVIHRDLKPSNVMIDRDGAVKVMDFGIARVAKDALTKVAMTNTIVGTPSYMAPEQEQGLVRKESDVYALALCFYEALTGRMAFGGTGAGMLLSKLKGSYAPVTTLAPELPGALDAVFAAALQPDPGKRLGSARELLSRVEAVVAKH